MYTKNFDNKISLYDSFVLKGISIILIILQHIGQAYHVRVVNPLGPIGVFIFLFLSAYGVTSSYLNKGIEGYFRRKFIKVYLPYVIAVILFCYINIFYFHISFNSDFVSFITLTKLPQGSFWFLILLFYWYVAFWILIKLKVLQAKLSILFPLLLIISLAICIATNFSRGFVWQILSFPLGILFALDRWHFRLSLRQFFLIFVVTIMLVITKKTAYVEANELGLIDTLIQIIMTLIISLCLIFYRDIYLYCCNVICFIKTLLYRIGIISFDLYLSHALFLDYLKKNPSNQTFFFVPNYLFCNVFILLFVQSFFCKKISKQYFLLE